jgi:hypothetical protein
MARITQTHGAATAHFVAPVRVRAVARWQPHEIEAVRQAIADGLDLDETHKLLPHRSRDSVKDRYYREREPQDRDEPAALCDARRQKDATEGSAKLLQAIIDAGLWVPLELRRVG